MREVGWGGRERGGREFLGEGEVRDGREEGSNEVGFLWTKQRAKQWDVRRAQRAPVRTRVYGSRERCTRELYPARRLSASPRWG